MTSLREQFKNWAKHLDSDGYFGAMEAWELLGPVIEAADAHDLLKLDRALDDLEEKLK